MHVHRFSVLGIGPVILRLFTYKGTEFVISLVPFGGYVQIAGMESEDPDAPRDEAAPPGGPDPKTSPLFRDKPLWARFLAIGGGPAANYLAAIVIAVGVYTSAGVNYPAAINIQSFGAASPAQAAGIQVGDTVVSIAGESVRGYPESTKFVEITAKHLGKTIDVTVDRDGETLTLPVNLNEQAPAFGFNFSFQGEYTPVPFGEALSRGVAFPFVKTAEQLTALWRVITGEAAGRVGGPVAIARAIKGSADQGFLDLLLFSALISTLLGMFNLLPVPALDGGRLVFLLFEMVARRPANRRMEEWVHAVGMIGLLGLLGYATIGDVRGPRQAPWETAVQEYRSEMARARGQLAETNPESTTPDSESSPAGPPPPPHADALPSAPTP